MVSALSRYIPRTTRYASDEEGEKVEINRPLNVPPTVTKRCKQHCNLHFLVLVEFISCHVVAGILVHSAHRMIILQRYNQADQLAKDVG